ncbi:MAG: tRNA uridine-5-carboxymethylaminomethyl(34) synthesis enzyme MnmG, partial [Bacteroidales bacterium]|nr:tRNA uridine-5-carboxymethylaminomethyl(34) synthesis enzyme MnmG [Bacteroidales bacterium]
DNADQRLTELSHNIGLASEERYAFTMEKYSQVERLSEIAANTKVKASQVNDFLESVGSAVLTDSKKMEEIAVRPEVSLEELLKIVPRGTFDREVIESVEISIKYRGYIDREKQMAAKIQRLEDLAIPEDFDFDKVAGLTIECRQKLKRYAPRTIAQASRISGVSPADISVLLVYFGR